MKRALIVATSVASLLLATAAFATTVVGTIKTINAGTHEVVLENGRSYHFAKDAGLAKMKTGQKVKIIYSSKGGRNEATSIGHAM